MQHDLFICHASEDKEPFVRALASTLRDHHVAVWYDEFSLNVGDSLRRSIDRGLASSRFGTIVLSKAFFAKQWPQYELDGLLERELAARTTLLLPVWLNVTHSEVMQYAPSLAGRVAVLSQRGVADVAAKLLQVIRPRESPLVIAREFLLGYDVTPPVVTDEYWLDVVEASNRLDSFGMSIPETATWHRWAFPLPETDGTAATRGERLAWSALQLAWTRRADELGISVTTRPELVLDFIENAPGLEDTCGAFPKLLAEYAPQLTIPGSGGPFEEVFEEAYQASVRKCEASRDADSRWGTATTTTKKGPLCDGVWALRSPTLGDYDSVFVADDYFHSGEFGPPVALWDDADHLFWLLSSGSNWLPESLRGKLLDGLIRCTRQWPWQRRREFDWPHCGVLFNEIISKTRGIPTFNAKEDILGRARLAKERLILPEDELALAKRFLEEDVPQRCMREDRLNDAERRRRPGTRKRRTPAGPG